MLFIEYDGVIYLLLVIYTKDNMQRTYLTLWRQYLTEAVETTQVKWKELQRQGYDVTPGTRPPDKNDIFNVDAELHATAQTQSAAALTLNAILNKKNIAGSTGLVIMRSDGNLVHAQFVTRVTQ